MDSKYKPAYDPAHSREPTEAERKVDLVFQRFIEDEIKLESNEEMIRRDSVLAEVRKIFLDWVQFVAQQILHIPSDVAEDAGGELFISGSHRLGVRDIGADIDTVCVAPNFCTREHFFTYLKEDLLKRSEVTAFNAVEDAFVPIISFDFRGVSIDLLFARLATNTVPRDLDILDDTILIGLDDATEKSLNGPRVTNMIFKLVGEKTFPNFLIVLRCIRKWAKRRGIYGNKLGYLGGVNCNILVAFICQLYPNFAPSALLFRFFKHYRTWNWPEPIMLNNIQQNPFGQMGVTHERMVWSPVANPNDLMPIITPAYPAMNSAFNVNTHTLLVMQNELSRGYEICESILKKNAWQDMNNWKKLFDPSDFFLRYPHYLACHIVGTGENEESRSWIGFVESRIRRFIQHPFLQTLPLLPPIHLYPVMSKTSKSANSICYFIGFHIDYDLMSKLGDNNLRIDECVARFQETLLDPDRGYKGERVEGLDFYVEHLTWKKLPKEIFEVYGGYEQAKQLREEMGFNNKRVQINVSNLVAETKEVPEATTSSGKQLLQQQQGQLQQQKATGAKVQVLEKKDEIAEFKKKAEKYGVEFEKVREIYFPTNKAEKGDELRKRFMAAAVGVESSKRRRTDGIIIKDVFPVDKESQIPYAIPTITWNLFEK